MKKVLGAIRNGVNFVLLGMIDIYRKFISPLKPPCCRFYPTCSCYAKQALIKYGPIKGTGKAIWRILRCNPFCKGGYDPLK